MTTTQADKIIRNYVRQNGRTMLRKNLHSLVEEYPGNKTLILNAANQFLGLPNDHQ